MNYQDMMTLKKGDEISAYSSDIGHFVGEITSSKGGAEPCLWVMNKERGISQQVYTGSNFTEDAWYKFKQHRRIGFADQEREDASMEWIRGL